MWCRFWHKVLYDLGLTKHKEPFQKLVHQGTTTTPTDIYTYPDVHTYPDIHTPTESWTYPDVSDAPPLFGVPPVLPLQA
jgi:hypothetical protein